MYVDKDKPDEKQRATTPKEYRGKIAVDRDVGASLLSTHPARDRIEARSQSAPVVGGDGEGRP
jgi:hypothetical protein